MMVVNAKVAPDPSGPMTGKVVLVTGASDGIGKVTALELARLGATVVGAGRNPAKCQSVERELRALSGNPSLEVICADLSTHAGVRSLADAFCAGHRRLDVLINNAGAFFWKRLLSADGIEMTWALNHLSYFDLTHQLLPMLQKSAPSRVVVVSSGAHRMGRIHFDDPELARGYNGWRAYAQSKLANLLFSNELARRLEGSGITSNALHPGFVRSRIGRTGGGLIGALYGFYQKAAAVTPEEGARTSIYLASSADVEGVSGRYFIDRQVAVPAEAALDDGAAARLWEISAQALAREAALAS